MGRKAEGPTFDKEFYDRFYRHPSTAVVKPEEFKRLASFVLGYLDYLNIPVRNVVDFGCGLGLWQAALEGLGRQVTSCLSGCFSKLPRVLQSTAARPQDVVSS